MKEILQDLPFDDLQEDASGIVMPASYGFCFFPDENKVSVIIRCRGLFVEGDDHIVYSIEFEKVCDRFNLWKQIKALSYIFGDNCGDAKSSGPFLVHCGSVFLDFGEKEGGYLDVENYHGCYEFEAGKGGTLEIYNTVFRFDEAHIDSWG